MIQLGHSSQSNQFKLITHILTRLSLPYRDLAHSRRSSQSSTDDGFSIHNRHHKSFLTLSGHPKPANEGLLKTGQR